MMLLKKLFTAIAVTATLAGCSRGAKAPQLPEWGDTLTSRSGLLTLVEYPGWTLAAIADPWHKKAGAKLLALVDDTAMAVVPEGIARLRVPVDRVIVTSAVHARALHEIGALDAIAGVADHQYVMDTAVKDRVWFEQAVDVGPASALNVERVLSANPQAVLATPYADSDHSAIAAMDIPVVEMADYMETDPLGRAEWIKLLGILTGRETIADSIFKDAVAQYEKLCSLADDAIYAQRPKILTETMTSGVWYVPGADSYMARMIGDAGGVNPFVEKKGSGSIPLDYPTVLDYAWDADIWLVKTYGPVPSRQSLLDDFHLYKNFKAMKHGAVWAANTAEVPLYEEFPFHPHYLLGDYIQIFHPELTKGKGMKLRYFKKLP